MNTIRFGIIGPSDRTQIWERRLRPIASVPEVIIAKKIEALADADACVILHDGPESAQIALEAIRMGLNVFLVSRIPTDHDTVESLYHTSEEANVVLQFAHWATFTQPSQWMMDHISKPKLIHIRKDIPHSAYLEYDAPFDQLWIEDLGLVLKWMNSQVHHVEANLINLNDNEEMAIQIYLRFDNGSTSVIFVNTMSTEARHERFAAGNKMTVQCDVLNKTIRVAQPGPDNHYYFEKRQMDDQVPADLALNMFIKSIQLRRPSAFSGYEAFQLSTVIDKIKDRIVR